MSIEILVLFKGHGRFIKITDQTRDILKIFYTEFEKIFKDVLENLGFQYEDLLFQLYNQQYEEYVDFSKHTRFGHNNKVKVTVKGTMLLAEGIYRMWSLMSHEGDSFMSYVDEGSGNLLVCAKGSQSQNPEMSKVELISVPVGHDEYWQIIFCNNHLALEADGDNLVLKSPDTQNSSQLFMDARNSYNGFWTFESKSENGKFIGADGAGEMQLYDVKSVDYADPTVYFLFYRLN